MLQNELEVVKFWQEQEVFQKSLNQTKTADSYVFLDGPPFVTGLPHLAHLSTGYPKDIFPRYWTQKGKYAVRRWGWDCHGLPIENMVQEQLGITHKRQIEEEVGIEAFNNAAKESIRNFDNAWRTIVERSGRWVDMDDQYRTMDTDYMESVWWGLGQLWHKGLLYKDYRVSMYSPSMGATLSHMEINDDVSYVNETIISPVIRFQVKESPTRKLTRKILEEVAFNYSEQLRYKLDIEKRLTTLEGLDENKKRTSLQELLNSGDPEFAGIEWDNFKTDLEARQEIEHLKDQLEYVHQNINKLKRMREILNSNHPLNLLSWTTTPWTLPSNVAVGVGADIEYAVYFLPTTKELVILAENRVVDIISTQFKETILNTPHMKAQMENLTDSSDFFEMLEVDILKMATFKGEDLTGLEYHPVFELTQNIDSYEEKATMYKVYTTEVVTDTEGTGILHIAPAYGPEDFEIKKQRNLPLIQSLNEYGEIRSDLPKNLSPVYGKKFTAANPLILEILKKEKKVFAEIKYQHKYPVFNRDNKKVYYCAQENWFIGETQFLESSIRQNEKINWFPEHIKEGRFRQGLETAPDWCISRNRYWGNPLPIWQNEDKTKVVFIDSLEKLMDLSLNPIFRLINSRDLNPDVYQKGKTVIFTDFSNKLPLGISASQHRSKNLTDLRKERDLSITVFAKYAQLILDEMMELFNNGKFETIQSLFTDDEQRLWTTWIYNLHPKSKKKSTTYYFYKRISDIQDDGEFTEEKQINLLDLHRPYIDDIYIIDEVKNIYRRIPEVMDCWVESGAMPWASYHYPFENKAFVEKNIPADYIVEYEGQIRGWFHALHVLSTGIFGINSFKNVHVHGTLLGYDKKKMSKSKGNFKPTDEYMELYGSDALRNYFTCSPYFQGETLSLNDKDMQATFRDTTITLSNTCTFLQYVLSSFAKRDLPLSYAHPLNKWWKAYTDNYAFLLNEAMENYDLMEASRLIIPYINELSTWYIRRAKDLLNTEFAIEVAGCLKETMKTFSIVTASLQPFNTERIWSVLKDSQDPISVHLTKFPHCYHITEPQKELLEKMKIFREMVSDIHSIRKEKNVRVRQPMYGDFSNMNIEFAFVDMLIKECNLIEKDLSKTEGEIWKNTNDIFGEVQLDLLIDKDLSVLGFTRDFERAVQDFRKKNNYKPNTIVRMKWFLDDIKDEEVLQKVLQQLNWKKLSVEVQWVEEMLDKNHQFKIKDLVTIFVEI
jgi:isoleucyl-tRNA synthetase